MLMVLFLAQLREQLGIAELQVPADDIDNIADLKQYLMNANPNWDQFFSTNKLLVAINHEYAKADARVKAGDEVAFFPPVTGG